MSIRLAISLSVGRPQSSCYCKYRQHHALQGSINLQSEISLRRPKPKWPTLAAISPTSANFELRSKSGQIWSTQSRVWSNSSEVVQCQSASANIGPSRATFGRDPCRTEVYRFRPDPDRDNVCPDLGRSCPTSKKYGTDARLHVRAIRANTMAHPGWLWSWLHSGLALQGVSRCRHAN